MEEKKLTDEEIVKAFEDEKEFLLKEEKRTGNAPDTQLVYIRGEAVLKIIDLIHRLQDEKKELENLCNKTYDDLTKEIERLTEELEKTKDNRNGWRNRAWDDEKVISQLTEKLDKTNAKLIEEYGKNAELQKQVDELKDERENMQAEIMETEELRLQAVKDTAKEICLKIIKGQPQPIKEIWVEWFKKECGVEVE